MSFDIIPVSAVVATRDRAPILLRTLESLGRQDVLPAEIIFVDASLCLETKEMVEQWRSGLPAGLQVKILRASDAGAAPQRNQGVAASTQAYVWFFDDDIIFEADCVRKLWIAISSDVGIGGVSAMIVNQRYGAPGIVSRTLFSLMSGRRESTYAGKVIGPAVNLLPEDRADLPEIVPVDWLNTTCVLYRRNALPIPPFDKIFSGYSLMEDVAISLRVGKIWRLVNARTAKIFHDSQPGAHKSDIRALAEMELMNRHYVMTQILERRRWIDFGRLILWESFHIAGGGRRGEVLMGKIRALRRIWRGR